MTAPELVDHVAEHPGIHFNDLVAALDVTPDKLARVSDRLERENAVVADSIYGKTHFYPPGYDTRERKVIALLRRETSRAILVTLLADGPTRPAAVTREVGIARGTLEWHLDRLTEADLVGKKRDGRRVELRAENAAEVEQLLAELRPSLPDRVLDRTARLLDHLLEEG